MDTTIFTQLLTGATLVTVLTYLAYQLKTVPLLLWLQIKKLFIYSVRIEETTALYPVFTTWLKDNHQEKFKTVLISLRSEVGEPNNTYPSDEEKLQRTMKMDELYYQQNAELFFIKYQGKRIIVDKQREKLENANNLRGLFLNHYTLRGWFAEKEITELMNVLIGIVNQPQKTDPIIWRNDQWGRWDYVGEVYGKDITNVILKDKQRIVEDIIEFEKNERWYLDRGIVYKRSYLLYGTPGNGKTSLCFALAKHFSKDIYFMNPASFENDSSLIQSFVKVKKGSILVIEDADAMFVKRNGKTNISFSTMLNCMDGAFSKYGVIMIVTTNHVEKLDPAFIREGRMDMKIAIYNPDIIHVNEYLHQFYHNGSVVNSLNKEFSMAEIQEICMKNKTDKDRALFEIGVVKDK